MVSSVSVKLFDVKLFDTIHILLISPLNVKGRGAKKGRFGKFSEAALIFMDTGYAYSFLPVSSS